MAGKLKARLHPIWAGGKAGYLYSVIFDGKLLIERSRDPECDAARALHAMGLTGKLTLLDGKTGIPRTVIDIERAAKLTVRKRDRGGLHGSMGALQIVARLPEPHSPERDVA